MPGPTNSSAAAPKRTTRLIVTTGGRNYKDGQTVSTALCTVLHDYGPNVLVMHGGARGADTMVEKWCQYHRVPTAIAYANWSTHGKGAGPRRNAAMIGVKPDLLIAFPGGKGTANCVEAAKKAGVEIFEPAVRVPCD